MQTRRIAARKFCKKFFKKDLETELGGEVSARKLNAEWKNRMFPGYFRNFYDAGEAERSEASGDIEEYAILLYETIRRAISGQKGL